MKILIIAVLVLFAAAGAYAFDFGGILSGCSKPPSSDKAAGKVPSPPAPTASGQLEKTGYSLNLKPKEAFDFIAAYKPVVIDVRTSGEYDSGHLEAASSLLDYYAPDFREQLSKLDRNAKYLIYCRSGNRSGSALGIMKDLGFTDIRHIEGGIKAWTGAGLPVVK